MRNDRFEHELCEHFGLSSAPTLITSRLTKAPITFSRLRRDWSERTARVDAGDPARKVRVDTTIGGCLRGAAV
jgi:hypothetical protein